MLAHDSVLILKKIIIQLVHTVVGSHFIVFLFLLLSNVLVYEVVFVVIWSSARDSTCSTSSDIVT